MAKEKACKACKMVYEGAKCPGCGSTESTDSFKGKVAVLNTEESEIAKKLKLEKKGNFSLRN
jgi:DNA-directed RNA polymerase subunit E"